MSTQIFQPYSRQLLSQPSRMDVLTPTVTAGQSAPEEKAEAGKSRKDTGVVDSNQKAALSAAELKKRAKEEKSARRARAVQEKQKGSILAQAHSQPSGQQPKSESQKTSKAQHKRGTSVEVKGVPFRGPQKLLSPVSEVPVGEDKTIEFFRHLYKPRTTSIAGVSRDVHPAVLALGLQMNNYTICGSCARLIATLQVFKKIIESYTTPPMNSLTRHLSSHVLSPQIEYLSSCRPLSISMGNAIRWLKLEVSRTDPSTPDAEAKKNLCDSIDEFIRERITYADRVIAKSAALKIRDGDVIMTYAKSITVQQALFIAHKEGKKFRVIVIDSRPLHEGKRLAAALARIGLDVKYCLLNGLSHNIQHVTKVFLGAHAMMSNGRLFSRIGTALVAMEANSADKPVIVLCETIKFTEKVALDSIVHNEVAPADELVIPDGILEGWHDVNRLQLCNPMYDVTPAEYIDVIVTESGNVPPTSVPVLHRLGNEVQG